MHAELKNVKPEVPDFFVIGNVKSGTTWLMECLNLHPETYCFNEINILDRVRDELARTMQQVNAAYLQQHQTSFQEFDYYDLQFEHEDVDALVGTLWKIAINKVPKDARFYGEKSPAYCKHLPEIVKQYPQTKYVHIVRDPRDVAISYWYHHLREWELYRTSQWYRGSSQHLPNQLIETEHRFEREQAGLILDMISYWKRDQTTIEMMKRRFPKKFHTIRYEDMKDTKELEKVFKFIGCENTNELLLENILNQTSVDNRPKAPNSFFKFGKSKNWEELDGELVDFMNRACSDWLEKYGYEL
jgi:hypothetical protein